MANRFKEFIKYQYNTYIILKYYIIKNKLLQNKLFAMFTCIFPMRLISCLHLSLYFFTPFVRQTYLRQIKNITRNYVKYDIHLWSLWYYILFSTKKKNNNKDNRYPFLTSRHFHYPRYSKYWISQFAAQLISTCWILYSNSCVVHIIYVYINTLYILIYSYIYIL